MTFKLEKPETWLMSAVLGPLIAALMKRHKIKAESAPPSGAEQAIRAGRKSQDLVVQEPIKLKKSGREVSHEC